MQTEYKEILGNQNIKGLLVDFDNTIYKYDPCHDKAIKAVHSNHFSDIEFEEFNDSYKAAQKQVKARIPNQAASHSRLLYFQNLLEKMEGKSNPKKSLVLEDEYWSAFREQMEIDPEIIDFIGLCRKNGLKICMVTDLTASVQFHKMCASGISELFDFIVTSEEAGAEKPGKAIFQLALEKMRLSESEVVMIGDDDTKDIYGANTLGIKAYSVKN